MTVNNAASVQLGMAKYVVFMSLENWTFEINSLNSDEDTDH